MDGVVVDVVFVFVSGSEVKRRCGLTREGDERDDVDIGFS